MVESGRILLVDDHPLFRHGLKSLIAGAFPDSIILEAGNLSEAGRILVDFKPGIAVLDVTLPDGDGVSFAGEYKPRYPNCRFFVLTMHRRSGLLLQAREAGCCGYFLKEGDGGALINAIRNDTGKFQISSQLRDFLDSAESDSEIAGNYAQLTRREKEIFKLFAEGLGYKEVAWKLDISPRTASVHRYNIFQKLNISSEVELVKVAREVGLQN